jgi:hypothetical protein
MRMMLVGVLLVGCRTTDLNSVETTDATTVATTVATTDTAPPPYIYTTKTEEKRPSLTSKQVETAMSEGLAAIMALDPMTLHTSYESFRALSDDDCPYYDEDYYETYSTTYWGDACTTAAGAVFDGFVYSQDYDGYFDGYYVYPEYRYLYGTARIIDTEGNTWEGAGYSTYYQFYATPSNTYSYWSSYGSFERTGDFDDQNWMDEGFSYELYNYIYYDNNSPGAEMSLDGNISGLNTIAGTLNIDNFYIYSETLGSPCPEEAFGTISVRSDEGDWFEATFDGPAYWGGASFPGECDGCADLYFEGAVVGTVCPDFSLLSGWEVEPW